MRQAAEAKLPAGLPVPLRPSIRALLKLARKFMLGHQIGKFAFRQTIDTVLAMARAAGGYLAADRRIDDPEDFFYLTVDELCDRLPVGARELVAVRRERRAEYEGIQLPSHWRGQPMAIPLVDEADATDGDQRLVGLCGSAGHVDGPVWIVHDPGTEMTDEGTFLSVRQPIPAGLRCCSWPVRLSST